MESRAGSPRVTVAVASRDRPLRLRWLLNALREQTLAPEQFEVVIAHDSRSPAVEEMLQSHVLRGCGQLRHLTFPPATQLAGAKRNAAWREARSPLVLFTDDDCRPEADWLERAVAAQQAHSGAILQGRTIPDPEEAVILRGAPWAHTVLIEPPTTWAETCNIGYPRELLERLGGFDERHQVGEDSDLALRARQHGVPLVPIPDMVVRHAVQERSLLGTLRAVERWGDMAWLAKRHPESRHSMWGRIWWVPEHAALSAAAAGALLARRHRAGLLLTLPWLRLSLGHRGYGPRGIARSLSELPGRAAIDATGIAVLARASLRYRTLLL